MSRSPTPGASGRLRLASRRLVGCAGLGLLELNRTRRRPAPDLGRARTIVVAHLFGLGDLIMTLPFLEALRVMAPDARVILVVRSTVAPFLDGVDSVDRILGVGVGAGGVVASCLRALSNSRSPRPDIGFLPFTGLASAICLAAFRPKHISGHIVDMQVRATFDFGRSRLAEVRHPTEMAFDSLRTIARVNRAEWGEPSLQLPAGARSLLPPARHGEWIALNPGVAWSARRWPIDRWIALARSLSELAGVALIGGPEDLPTTRRIESAVPGLLNLSAHTDAAALLGTLAACRVVVSSDAGPLHLARALAIPSVGLFGPVDPSLRRHGGRTAIDLIASPAIECSPCHSGEYPPACSLPDCMAAISVASVLEAIETLRENRPHEVST
ncbi:MAG: hypothetical protein CME06_04155 [Gemmatimonadetes bacterium]|nr:hypothetical protein [Gemmatimonadota bacterium]